MNEYLPWMTLALLGVYHGLNPGMGWLFAVCLGLQDRSRVPVIRAFAPIAVGHAASVAVVVALVGVAQIWVPPDVLRLIGASALIAFGLYKLLAPLSHLRWVGMRVNARDLVVWSFLMATAHGAGLMLVPVLPRLPPEAANQIAAAAHTEIAISETMAGPVTHLLAVGVHTTAAFIIMFSIAIVVFDRMGSAILRRAWFNFDKIWAGALILAGIVAFLF